MSNEPKNTINHEELFGPLLTRKEAAERLGVSLRHLDRLLDNGGIYSLKLGKSVRIKPKDLQDYIHSQLNPMNLREVCLALSFTKQTVLSLAENGVLPTIKNKKEFYVNKIDFEIWRKQFKSNNIIFGSCTSRAEHIAQNLRKIGCEVELLRCSLCNPKIDPQKIHHVATVICCRCDLYFCSLHCHHWLNTKPITEEPDALCDTCYALFAHKKEIFL